MTIERVTAKDIDRAAEVHAVSWRESHKGFCSEEFVKAHTKERQKKYLEQEMENGKTFYLLTDGEAKGIISIKGSLIENLYVLPSEQRKGYGARLLHFAQQKCQGNPTLWILSNNETAKQFYTKHGYRFTGNVKPLKNSLLEMEMQLE